MKWRNQLLALFCLLVFFAFGVFYFQYWVVQKPFGIILFVAEGLDAQTLAAARSHADSADRALALDSFPYTAFLMNDSADSAVPDPAAAATALATGTKTRNGSVALDADGETLVALLRRARETGRMTGLITDGNLTGPTAASFYGHAERSDGWEEFARQLIETSEIDVVLGGGSADFLPEAHGGRRTDGKDLLSAAREAGYSLVQSLAELEEVPRWRRAKLLGLFDDKEHATKEATTTPAEQPTLSDLVRRGIELLQFHRGGYLIVVDAAALRKAGGESRERQTAAVELDRAIAVASEYTGEKSAIFVCGDVADDVNDADRDMSLPPATEPDLFFWGSLPKVWNADDSKVVLWDWNFEREIATTSALSLSRDQRSLTKSGQTRRAADVPAFGMGLGADALHGTLDNTAIFAIISDNL
ncbi:MAG: alkaline phosphatase [Chthoniobacterales bacterium]